MRVLRSVIGTDRHIARDRAKVVSVEVLEAR